MGVVVFDYDTDLHIGSVCGKSHFTIKTNQNIFKTTKAMNHIRPTTFELCIQIKGATKECPIFRDLGDLAAHRMQENDKHYMPELIIMGIEMGSDYRECFGDPVFNGENMSVNMLIGHDLAGKIIKLLQDESKPKG